MLNRNYAYISHGTVYTMYIQQQVVEPRILQACAVVKLCHLLIFLRVLKK